MATATSKIPVSGGPRARLGFKNPRAKIAVQGNRGIKIVRAVTIRRPAAELYRFWRDVGNLAPIVQHSATITTSSPEDSHWSVSAPGGRRVEWDAVIINDAPDRLIAWRSRAGAEVANAGTVRFEPATGDQETKVTVALEYDPPGGRLGATVAKLTRDSAGAQVADALRRFKTVMETPATPPRAG